MKLFSVACYARLEVFCCSDDGCENDVHEIWMVPVVVMLGVVLLESLCQCRGVVWW